MTFWIQSVRQTWSSLALESTGVKSAVCVPPWRAGLVKMLSNNGLFLPCCHSSKDSGCSAGKSGELGGNPGESSRSKSSKSSSTSSWSHSSSDSCVKSSGRTTSCGESTKESPGEASAGRDSFPLGEDLASSGGSRGSGGSLPSVRKNLSISFNICFQPKHVWHEA